MHWSRSSSGGLPWLAALVLVSFLSSAGFAEVLSIGRSLGPHGPPAVVSDPRGDGLIIASVRRPDSGADIYAWPLGVPATTSRWTSEGVVICSAPGDQLNPVAAPDGHGGYVVAWEDWRNAKAPQIYAHHVLASGVVDPSWSEGGLLVNPEDAAQTAPRIAFDGDGGALIAWETAGQNLHDIELQRVTRSGKFLPSWPTNGLHLDPRAAERTSVAMLPDGAGGALVSWLEAGEDSKWAMRLRHVLGSAELDVRWPDGGMTVCDELDGTSSSAMVSDGNGGAIVAWTDRRHEGVANVYARRILESGLADPRWPEHGAAITVTPTGQRYPSLLADGASGVFVTWQDSRLDGNESIYLQHLSEAGTIAAGWPEQGLRVSAERGQRVSAQAVGLGQDLLVAWLDRSVPGVARPEVQHVLQSGRLDSSWPEEGVALSSSAAGDIALAQAKDGGGFCLWRDLGSSGLGMVSLSSDALALKEAGLPATPAITMLFAPRPNPARGEITIRFSLASRTAARLSVFDLQGRRVASLVDGVLDAGPHQAVWNGEVTGRPGPRSGLYFVRLEADGQHFTKRLATVR